VVQGRTRCLGVVRLVAVCALCVWAAPAAAQDFGGPTAPDLDIQRFVPSPSPYGIFTVESAKVASELQVSGGLVLNYASEPLVLKQVDGDERIVVVDEQLAADLLFSLGLFDVMELNLGLPVYFLNTATVGPQAIEGATVGDLRLRARFSLLDSEEAPVGVAVFAQVGFPTGDDTAFTSAGQYTLRPGVVVDTRIRRLLLAVNLSTQLQEARDFGNLNLSSELYYSAGAQYELVEDRLFVGGEVFGSSPFEDAFEENTSPLEGLLGLKLRTDANIHFEAGASTGFVAGYGSPAWRVFGGVRYASYDNDWDRDGILNKDDQCPRDPEDIDLFEDEDGCPDLDNDQDGIPDVTDNCPLDPEDVDQFEDEDGCPDLDNDQDGIPDSSDACPNEPEDLDGFEDEDGCPDPDNDKDGVLDKEDDCPNVPGPRENKGCPYQDRDKDGIADPVDACPDVPEDKDGFEDEDGCPETDNDKDGIPDVQDRCPMDAGPKKNFGCPLDTKAVIDPINSEIVILEQVFFDVDKDTIKERSFPVLNAVALILKKNPQVKRVEIQGHTDDQGTEVYNLDLSNRRAASVRTYLIGKGIEPERLDSKGYGETSPKVPIEGLKGRALNDARAENRRVQFIILQKGDRAGAEVQSE
jgi:outer membrane protein OmpA-like peptidoglycan-associated protein